MDSSSTHTRPPCTCQKHPAGGFPIWSSDTCPRHAPPQDTTGHIPQEIQGRTDGHEAHRIAQAIQEDARRATPSQLESATQLLAGLDQKEREVRAKLRIAEQLLEEAAAEIGHISRELYKTHSSAEDAGWSRILENRDTGDEQ